MVLYILGQCQTMIIIECWGDLITWVQPGLKMDSNTVIHGIKVGQNPAIMMLTSGRSIKSQPHATTHTDVVMTRHVGSIHARTRRSAKQFNSKTVTNSA